MALISTNCWKEGQLLSGERLETHNLELSEVPLQKMEAFLDCVPFDVVLGSVILHRIRKYASRGRPPLHEQCFKAHLELSFFLEVEGVNL